MTRDASRHDFVEGWRVAGVTEATGLDVGNGNVARALRAGNKMAILALRGPMFFVIEARLGEVIAQANRSVFSNLSESLAQFLVGKRAAFSEEFGKIFENALGSGHILRVAINGNVLTARVNAYIEQRFKIFDVLIVNAEERFEAARWKFDLLQNLKRSPFAERNWFSLFSGV